MANATNDDQMEEQSLFDQFGGTSKMTLFVEDFMEGIMGDSELACYHDKF